MVVIQLSFQMVALWRDDIEQVVVRLEPQFCILLTNFVHPTGLRHQRVRIRFGLLNIANEILQLRPILRTDHFLFLACGEFSISQVVTKLSVHCRDRVLSFLASKL